MPWTSTAALDVQPRGPSRWGLFLLASVVAHGALLAALPAARGRVGLAAAARELRVELSIGTASGAAVLRVSSAAPASARPPRAPDARAASAAPPPPALADILPALPLPAAPSPASGRPADAASLAAQSRAAAAAQLQAELQAALRSYAGVALGAVTCHVAVASCEPAPAAEAAPPLAQLLALVARANEQGLLRYPVTLGLGEARIRID